VYTRQSLRNELAKIYRNASDGFMWEEKRSSKTTALDDIERYCWTAYSKARSAAGPQVIGRIPDIHQSIQAKIAGIFGRQTLLNAGTRGNVLRMDKWCLVMNDCWLLGGVHRVASFALMSRATWQNVWNPEIRSFVVTARELIGLNEFGYAKEPGRILGPGSQAVATYVCADPIRARSADLEDYHLSVALRESRGALGAAELVRA
jgi:hypothetical protein